VAPGGPPEGQCKKTQRLVCYTNLDNSFRSMQNEWPNTLPMLSHGI
jgi:hypothetical protein